MTGDDPKCQGTTVAPSEGRPWSGTPRAEDHDALARLLRETPEGAPIVWLARRLFGDDVEPGDADWQFVKRHCDRYHHVFRPTARVAVKTASGEYENRETAPDFTWTKPTAMPAEGVLDTASGITACAGGGRSGSDALANAEVCLSARAALTTAGAWGDVVGAFAGKRVGEETAAGGPERTRFNDVRRALRGRDRVETAFAGALAAGFEQGVMVTATTARSQFESIHDAAGGLLRDVKLMREKIGRAIGPPGDDGAPPSVTVCEPTATGIPHAHTVLFGVMPDALPSKHALHTYWWEQRERGQQVDSKPLVTDGGTWTWGGDDPAGANGCPPAAYLQQGATALATVATVDAEDVRAVAAAYRTRGDEPMNAATAPEKDTAVAAETGVDAGAVRRAAWYFGTGLKTATRPSPALSTAVESDGEKR